MSQKSEIIALLRQEEGVRYIPYIDSLGYPTVGVGFKLGPQGAPLNHYTFTLSDNTIDAWLDINLSNIQESMLQHPEISAALPHCNSPRKDILISMAYQMGVSGLGGFQRMLSAIIIENWDDVANHMLCSTWAKQTPGRAQRHAEVMKSGSLRFAYNF